MLEHDLRIIAVELFAKNHRYRGIDALAHLHLRHDQRRLAGMIDADEGIGRKLAHSAVRSWLDLVFRPDRKPEGEHESAGHAGRENTAAREGWRELAAIAHGGLL
jgi:hypothetical protein